MEGSRILRMGTVWKNLYFYQKTDTLYQLTVVFCQRFLPSFGDRTVDQMVQAARSGKQNIVEGSEDGKTSTEMEIKLLNVARSSLGELCEDYRDYLKSHDMVMWDKDHPRYDAMQSYCSQHNRYEDYSDMAKRMDAETFCNLAITMCLMTDKMMNSYLQRLEREFVTEGGIKERMYAARTGYRAEQDRQFRALQEEVKRLRGILEEHGIEY